MTIVLPVAVVLMSARLKQSAKVIYMLLIPSFVPTAVHVPMFARLKQFLQNNLSDKRRGCAGQSGSASFSFLQTIPFRSIRQIFHFIWQLFLVPSESSFPFHQTAHSIPSGSSFPFHLTVKPIQTHFLKKYPKQENKLSP